MRALRSFGYATDLFLVSLGGIVEERDRYVVVRTPSNPDYRWGNYLFYPDAPEPDASRRGSGRCWLDDLDVEFPGASSLLLTWDRPDGAEGDIERFLANGFERDVSVILTASPSMVARPPRWNTDVRVVEVTEERDWQRAEGALVNAFTPHRHGTLTDLRRFVTRQLAHYRTVRARGLGRWFAALVDGEMAGVLGIVQQGAVGRFQLVGTDPAFGRRGICSTLVYAASRIAIEEMGITTLVLAADANYHAAKVYESVGFRPTEKLVALAKWPPAA